MAIVVPGRYSVDFLKITIVKTAIRSDSDSYVSELQSGSYLSELRYGCGSQPTPTPTIEIRKVEEVPEPASLILFGTGLLAFAGGLRRRYARKKSDESTETGRTRNELHTFCQQKLSICVRCAFSILS
jgi:hypothetical protein